MNEKLYGLIGVVLGLTALVALSAHPKTKVVTTVQPLRVANHSTRFVQTLQYNIYTFTVSAPDSGAVGELAVKAYRGQLLLTNFRVRVEGNVVGAEVADLDKNRFPELYVYSRSRGSGSYGRVYGWQFLPERKADVVLVNWRLPLTRGYMGHDSLWIERDILCRRYPVLNTDTGNAEPTGSNRLVRYRLRPVGPGYALVAER